MYNKHKFNLLVQLIEVASSKAPAILFRPELFWNFKTNVRMMMSIFYYRVGPAETEHLLEHSPSLSWAVWPETELTSVQSLELTGDKNALKGLIKNPDTCLIPPKKGEILTRELKSFPVC